MTVANRLSRELSANTRARPRATPDPRGNLEHSLWTEIPFSNKPQRPDVISVEASE